MTTARRKSCGAKHRHASQGAAEAHIRALEKISGGSRTDLHAYPCVHCKSWHAGHKKKGTYRGVKK